MYRSCAAQDLYIAYCNYQSIRVNGNLTRQKHSFFQKKLLYMTWFYAIIKLGKKPIKNVGFVMSALQRRG